MQDNESINSVRLMHQSLVKNVPFDQIEHVPNEFLQSEIAVEDSCLCISYQYFSLHYDNLLKELGKTKPEEYQKNHWIAEMLLIMNGENNNAWNYKRAMLDSKILNIERELKFNAAICYKNKKSSSYYDYRIRLYEQFLQKNHSKSQLLVIYQRESQLIWKILARFFRNYYCWMYRNRIFKLFEEIIGEDLTKLQIRLLHKFIESNPNDYSAYSRLIPIIKQSQTDLVEQAIWIQELEDFCIVAYQHKESYRHIYTYKTFLENCESKTK